MVLYDNVILVDYDQVCVYWSHSFAWWMRSNGYLEKVCAASVYSIEEAYGVSADLADLLVKMFNESAEMSRLPPLRDAIKYIRKLHEEHGFVFHCISAIHDSPATREARWTNIHKLFGQTAFERLELCNAPQNKYQILAAYAGSGCYWVEDVYENAAYGLDHGLKPLLMRQPHNHQAKDPLIPFVDTWKEVYEYVIGERIHPTDL